METVHTVPSINLTESMSLYDLALVCRQLDDGLIELSKDQMTLLGELLRAKPDRYREARDGMLVKAKQHREYAAEHIERARSLEARVESMDRRLLGIMELMGSDRLAGDEWVVKITRSKALEISDEAKVPDESIREAFPEFVRSKLEWDKRALTTAIKNETHVINFAQLVDRPHLAFDVKS